MSSDLNWMIVRNNHAFLCKKKNIKKPFSSEPGNLKNVNSKRYNGFVNKKSLAIVPGKQGVVLNFKTAKNLHKPKWSTIRRTIRKTGRPGLASIRNFFEHNKYPKSLLKPALRRTSAIHRSQKAIPFTSKRAIRKMKKTGKVTKQGKSKKSD